MAEDVHKLASLLLERNVIDETIAAVIERPMTAELLGECVVDDPRTPLRQYNPPEYDMLTVTISGFCRSEKGWNSSADTYSVPLYMMSDCEGMA